MGKGKKPGRGKGNRANTLAKHWHSFTFKGFEKQKERLLTGFKFFKKKYFAWHYLHR